MLRWRNRSWFLVSTLFTTVLLGSYYHYRRTRYIEIWKKEFGAFDWGVYNTSSSGSSGVQRWIMGHRGRASIQLEGGGGGRFVN